MYPEIMLIPMREELTRAGLKEARTAAEVDAALAQPGTTMLVVNSVCGCAAMLRMPPPTARGMNTLRAVRATTSAMISRASEEAVISRKTSSSAPSRL